VEIDAGIERVFIDRECSKKSPCVFSKCYDIRRLNKILHPTCFLTTLLNELDHYHYKNIGIDL